MKDIFAIASLAVSLGANVPYIIETVQGKIKPERISWFLWTILGGVYFFSAILDTGATLYTLGEVLAPVVVFAVALKYGVGGKSRFDLISLTVASIAFVLLFVLDGVLASLLLALFIDSIGVVLTIRKVRRDHTSESRIFWGLGVVSSTLALLSLESYVLVAYLFPTYVLVVSAYIWHEARPGKPHPERIEEL